MCIRDRRLADIFYLYGELKNARKLASWVVKARMHRRMETTEEFMEVVKPLFERDREKKELAKVFQALRIEVNQEMDALKEMLTAAVELLRPGGRLVVLTYHSLEDRMVKNLVKTGNVEGDVYKRQVRLLSRLRRKGLPCSCLLHSCRRRSRCRGLRKWGRLR